MGNTRDYRDLGGDDEDEDVIDSSGDDSQSESDDTLYLGDKFRIRVLPSLQILHYCQQRPARDIDTWGIVENATSDLYFTPYECEQIASLGVGKKVTQLKEKEASVGNYKQLLKQVNVLHSSHHASHNLGDPLTSLLLLADGQLTLEQLLMLRLPNLVEVFLSCCETSLTTPTLTDDVLTLATGFLAAGASNVMATLWSVGDLATALFCIFYYQERQKPPSIPSYKGGRLNSREENQSLKSRSQALQKAQQRLRGLTGEQLKRDHAEAIEQMLLSQLEATDDDKVKEKIQGQIDFLHDRCEQKYPFANPFYWAGFVSQGMDT